MNVRHAVPAILLVWFLMTPPLDGGGASDELAPLARWNRAKSYQRAADCEMERMSALNYPTIDATQAKVLQQAHCIESKDPRLPK